MLAELPAANAAFSIIKQTVQNSGDIMKAGRAIGDFISAKEELQRQGNKKRARGVGGNDLEEFLALEQIKQKEAELKQIMILSGRPGLWRDYQKFCEDAKDGRAKAKQKAIRQQTMEKVGNAGVAIIILAGLVGLVVWGLWIKGALAQSNDWANDLTTCRLVKCMKIDKTQEACVYRGSQNVQETLFFSLTPREWKPREYLCQWQPDQPPPPNVFDVLKAIKDSQN